LLNFFPQKKFEFLLNTKTKKKNSFIIFFFKKDHSKLYEEILIKSRLAKELRFLFNGLKYKGYAHLKLNQWFSLSLSTFSLESDPLLPLSPFQSIILLGEKEESINTNNNHSPSAPILFFLLKDIIWLRIKINSLSLN
jgi:hypothetical protein